MRSQNNITKITGQRLTIKGSEFQSTILLTQLRILECTDPCLFTKKLPCYWETSPLWGIPACTPQVDYSTCPWRNARLMHAVYTFKKEIIHRYELFFSHIQGLSQALHCWGSFSSHSFCSNTFFFFSCIHEVTAALTTLTIPIRGVCVCSNMVLAILVFLIH